MASSFELKELPSPSAFSPSPPASPTRKTAKTAKPDLSINTSLPARSASSSNTISRHGERNRAETVPEWEREEHAAPVIQRTERRRSSRGRKDRAKDTLSEMGLGINSNSKERGYSRIPFNESDYNTPTTVGSLDLGAYTPSCEHDTSPQAFHPKSVSRFRLRLLYTLVPVISLTMLVLYTVLIIDHTQRSLMKKIQYPGLGSQTQAQAQVTGGTGQGVLGTTGTTTTASSENTVGVETDSQESGLGPLKTGSGGAMVGIGAGSDLGSEREKPQGWKGVAIPASEQQGPTILVPSGVAITVTEETPVAQIIPPPPLYPTQQQQPAPSTPQTVPTSVPASSVKLPGYPYPLSCGPTPEAARAQNCVFDIMSYAWLPPPCYDHNLTTSFIAMKSRSISLSGSSSHTKISTTTNLQKGQTLTAGWRYYRHYSDATPLDTSLVESGNIESVYVTWEWHREHCLFMWRKLHRSLLTYGGGGDVLGDASMAVERGKEMMVDGYVGVYDHTLKCGESLRGGVGIDGDDVNTLIRMKFPTCGIWKEGK